MKKFYPILFILCNIVLAVITFFSFNEAYARDERKFGHTDSSNLLADFFYVMRFPTHTIFPALTRTPLYFALGLIINCMFYSLIIERLVFYVVKIWPDEDPDEQQVGS